MKVHTRRRGTQAKQIRIFKYRGNEWNTYMSLHVL